MNETVLEYIFFGLLKDYWFPALNSIKEPKGSVSSLITWVVLLLIIGTTVYQLSVKHYTKLFLILCVITVFLGIGTLIVSLMGIVGGGLFIISLKAISDSHPIKIDKEDKSSWDFYEREIKKREADSLASSIRRNMSDEERRQMEHELDKIKEYYKNFDGTDDIDDFLKKYR